MFNRDKKKREGERIHIRWPEVKLDEAELCKYFQFLLSPTVFVNQIPFLFGPPFAPDEERKNNPPVH